MVSPVSTKDWVRGERIGDGSYGCVYLASTTNTDHPPFAVKSAPLPFRSLSSTLQKEQRILDQFLDCQEILTCYGSCKSHEFNTILFNLHLEYAPGGSLLNLIRDHGGKMPESLVKNCTGMILKGLSRIHERGIVHCDLKPDNILVFPGDQGVRVKLADFGLAKEPGEELSVDDTSCTFRGTPHYMSPESLEMDIGPPLDIWSLGCVVVQMLTGDSPFEGLRKSGLVNKLLFEKEAPRIPDEVSKQEKDFLMRCFEVEPSKRWTADMLLTHPFVSTTTDEEEKYNTSRLKETEQVMDFPTARCLEAFGEWNLKDLGFLLSF